MHCNAQSTSWREHVVSRQGPLPRVRHSLSMTPEQRPRNYIGGRYGACGGYSGHAEHARLTISSSSRSRHRVGEIEPSETSRSRHRVVRMITKRSQFSYGAENVINEQPRRLWSPERLPFLQQPRLIELEAAASRLEVTNAKFHVRHTEEVHSIWKKQLNALTTNTSAASSGFLRQQDLILNGIDLLLQLLRYFISLMPNSQQVSSNDLCDGTCLQTLLLQLDNQMWKL